MVALVAVQYTPTYADGNVTVDTVFFKGTHPIFLVKNSSALVGFPLGILQYNKHLHILQLRLLHAGFLHIKFEHVSPRFNIVANNCR